MVRPGGIEPPRSRVKSPLLSHLAIGAYGTGYRNRTHVARAKTLRPTIERNRYVLWTPWESNPLGIATSA